MAGWRSEIGDLVLPRACVGCARPGTSLCADCIAGSEPILVPALVTVVAAGAYEGALRSAVLAYKERGRRDLGTAMAGLLAQSVRLLLEAAEPATGPVVLVPAPSSRAASRARGGAHMIRLARRVAELTGLAVAPHAVRLHRAVLDSAGLNIRERSKNLCGAMLASPPPAGVVAVVVDDIVTTGATLTECVRSLEAAGWPIYGAAVIAATPLRD